MSKMPAIVYNQTNTITVDKNIKNQIPMTG